MANIRVEDSRAKGCPKRKTWVNILKGEMFKTRDEATQVRLGNQEDRQLT